MAPSHSRGTQLAGSWVVPELSELLPVVEGSTGPVLEVPGSPEEELAASVVPEVVGAGPVVGSTVVMTDVVLDPEVLASVSPVSPPLQADRVTAMKQGRRWVSRRR